MNCNAYPNGHVMGDYRSSSLWPEPLFIWKLGEIYVTRSIMVLMTLTSDPPLPQNRTLCCSDRPASPPMYTTSLLARYSMDFVLLGPMRNGGTILRGLLLDAQGLLPLRAMVIDSSRWTRGGEQDLESSNASYPTVKVSDSQSSKLAVYVPLFCRHHWHSSFSHSSPHVSLSQTMTRFPPQPIPFPTPLHLHSSYTCPPSHVSLSRFL
ncbi:hypothetical protein VNO80_21096 [Phaseolus coccineus]|uniref:Uncharacterized protein n=1 Tax=Phaseolus coccineus TaxID=3886 RepID=A0AAN9M2J4_PHACN